MNRILSTVLFSVALAGADTEISQAQTRQATPRYPFEEMRVALLSGVTLTDSQRVKIESIARGYWEHMHANDARMNGAPKDSIRAFLKVLQEKQTNDLRRVLTPGQQKTFDTNRDALPKR